MVPPDASMLRPLVYNGFRVTKRVRSLQAFLVLALTAVFASQAYGQSVPAPSIESLQKQLREITETARGRDHAIDKLGKLLDDLLWHSKLSDIATVDKVSVTSRPSRTANDPGRPLVIYAYVFAPKTRAPARAPLVIFVHGGVHADFDTSNAHIVRELIQEGYIVVAPEYRGSTGYGEAFYNEIDYGGAEVDDTFVVRNWAVESLADVDPARVGILGWSHGGYIALFNIFNWPDAYQAAYAGVPVSDLVQRMTYKPQVYRDTFASFIGNHAADDPSEYRKRSPVSHASKLRTPLLIHSTTNDEDVSVSEVERLIAALKAAGKTFDYKIYTDAPGGHFFNRLDTSLALESRREIYAFLAKALKPAARISAPR